MLGRWLHGEAPTPEEMRDLRLIGGDVQAVGEAIWITTARTQVAAPHLPYRSAQKRKVQSPIGDLVHVHIVVAIQVRLVGDQRVVRREHVVGGIAARIRDPLDVGAQYAFIITYNGRDYAGIEPFGIQASTPNGMIFLNASRFPK